MDPTKLPTNKVPAQPIPTQPMMPVKPVVPQTAGRSPEVESMRHELVVKAPEPVKPVPDLPKRVESQPKNRLEVSANLELSKEVAPGLAEVHHPDEPIKLPSQVVGAGMTSVPLPLGTDTYVAPPLVLPLGQQQLEKGLHESVKHSIRWLAEWCVKQLKEAHGMAKRTIKK